MSNHRPTLMGWSADATVVGISTYIGSITRAMDRPILTASLNRVIQFFVESESFSSVYETKPRLDRLVPGLCQCVELALPVFCRAVDTGEASATHCRPLLQEPEAS